MSFGRLAVWMEWTESGQPVLVTDDPMQAAPLHAIQVSYCPLCGENVEKDFSGGVEDEK